MTEKAGKAGLFYYLDPHGRVQRFPRDDMDTLGNKNEDDFANVVHGVGWAFGFASWQGVKFHYIIIMYPGNWLARPDSFMNKAALGKSDNKLTGGSFFWFDFMLPKAYQNSNFQIEFSGFLRLWRFEYCPVRRPIKFKKNDFFQIFFVFAGFLRGLRGRAIRNFRYFTIPAP